MFQVINGSKEQEAYIESLPVLLFIEVGGFISLLGYYRENMGLIICYLFILLASIKDLLSLTGKRIQVRVAIHVFQSSILKLADKLPNAWRYKTH